LRAEPVLFTKCICKV